MYCEEATRFSIRFRKDEIHMKKLLLLAILMLALVITAVACTETPSESDTTAAVTTTVEDPTDEPTGEDTTVSEVPTEEPTEDPTEVPSEVPSEVPTEEITTAEPLPYKTPEEAGQKAASFDTFYVNGSMYFEADGGAGDKLTAQDNTVTFEIGAVHDSMMLRGWIGFPQEIDSFGYYIDSYDFVYGNFATATEDGVKNAGGEYASRFEILVPLSQLGVGEHRVGFIVKLADGTVVLLRDELKVVIKGLEITGDIRFHTSVDHINKKGPNGAPYYSGRGGNKWDVIDAVADGHTVGEDYILTVGGWMGTDGGVNRYVWSVDAVNWFDVQAGGLDGEPVSGHYASIGFTDALKNGLFNNDNCLVINLSAFEGQTVNVIVAAVPETAQDKVIPFVTIEGLTLIDQPDDITNGFTSDIASQEIGTTLDASDLGQYFVVELPLGSEGIIANGDGKLYGLTGVSDIYADVNGKYYIKVSGFTADTNSYMFVRGYKVVNADSLIEAANNGAGMKINNYYEMDGTDGWKMGGAGIYATMSNGVVHIMIKAYNPEFYTRVANKIYSIPCDGDELAMADDGKTVSILVDGKTIATIDLSGTVIYDDINEVLPRNGFAATAVVTLADGTTETIENTLIADSCNCQTGLVVRNGGFRFTDVEVGAYSAIEVPEIEMSSDRENIALGKPTSSNSIENDVNVPSNANDGDVNTRYGAAPNGAADFILDLEDVYTVEEISIYFQISMLPYTVSYSSDGENYTVLHEGAAITTPDGFVTVLKNGAVDMRYIKVSRPAGSDDPSAGEWLSIYEIYVYAA